MKTNPIDRSWLSPLVTVAFCVIGATGVMLFFHVKNGAIVSLHEWFGWGFVIAGLFHLLLNWRPLAGYLRRRGALIALVLSGAMVVGLAVAGGSKQERGGGGVRSAMAVMLALDANGNGTIDGGEISDSSVVLKNLDKNGDGQLSPDELQPQRGAGEGHAH